MTNNLVGQGYHTVSPYLIVKDGAKAIEFYQQAFAAVELVRMEMPDGKIGYAELQIGDSIIMLADEFPEMGTHGPEKFGGSPMRLHLYVKDVDFFINHLVSVGMTLIRPIEDKFFGDRSGSVEDPFGHHWTLATRKENVSREEMVNRFQIMITNAAAAQAET